VVDRGTHRVRLLDYVTSITSDLAGSATGASGFADGWGTSAQFNTPAAIAFSAASAVAYLADSANNRIRGVGVSGQVTTLVGTSTANNVDGVGTNARLSSPVGLALSSDGSTLYISQAGFHNLRRLATDSLTLTTLAGSPGGAPGYLDAPGTAALFTNPGYLALHEPSGVLFVVDGSPGARVRAVAVGTAGGGSASAAPPPVSTFVGSTTTSNPTFKDGTGTAAAFRGLVGLAVEAGSGALVLGEALGYSLRRADLGSAAVTTLAGLSGTAGYTDTWASEARLGIVDGLLSPLPGVTIFSDADSHTIRMLTCPPPPATQSPLPGATALPSL